MPKRVAKEAKRVPLNCLVLPETLAWLRAADVSQGVAVDLAVARAKAHVADGWQPLNAQEGDVIIATVKPIRSTNSRPFKGELLKPSAKKKGNEALEQKK